MLGLVFGTASIDMTIVVSELLDVKCSEVWFGKFLRTERRSVLILLVFEAVNQSQLFNHFYNCHLRSINSKSFGKYWLESKVIQQRLDDEYHLFHI